MTNEISPAQAILEISRGYSIFFVNDQSFFFKHFSIEQMLELEEYEEVQLRRAKKNGIKTTETLLSEAIEIGSWSKKKDDEIKSLDWTINHSLKALKKMHDPTQRKSLESHVNEEQKKLDNLRDDKNKICGYSAEVLAQQKKIARMLRVCLFYDNEFEQKIEEKDLIIAGPLVFPKFAELAQKETLLKSSYLTYFFEVFISSSNPVDLFQADFRSLTVFQKGVISYSKSLHNKIKNIEMPDEITGDPVKMYDYEEPKDKGEGNQSEGLDDIKRKMKARGGEVKAEDFLS